MEMGSDLYICILVASIPPRLPPRKVQLSPQGEPPDYNRQQGF